VYCMKVHVVACYSTDGVCACYDVNDARIPNTSSFHRGRESVSLASLGQAGLQLAGGLKKLSRGRKKFLASGWTLKFAYAPHIQDLTSGWKSFGPYAKHMSRALSEATIKFTSGHQSLVDAYAQHQLSIKKHR